MSEQPIIKVQDLYKTYRAGDVDVHALQGANLAGGKGRVCFRRRRFRIW